jgi:transposase
VKRVAVASPRLVRAIAYARVKTDKVDAATLAQLHAAGFLPAVWVANDDTYSRRRQIAERAAGVPPTIRLWRRLTPTKNVTSIR